MIRFAAYASERFKGGPYYPLILAIIKFTGALLAEAGSAYLIVQASNVKGTLGAFLGMSIVANIDNYHIKNICNEWFYDAEPSFTNWGPIETVSIVGSYKYFKINTMATVTNAHHSLFN